MAVLRNHLIRLHFEAMRDLTWVQDLEPKFRRHGVNSEMLEDYRQAWNRNAEHKDWPWWQIEAKQYTTDRLEDMLADCVEKLNAIGLGEWRREKEAEQAKERDTGIEM